MSMGVGGKKFLPNEVTGVKVSDFCTELWKNGFWIKKMAFELKKKRVKNKNDIAFFSSVGLSQTH